MSSLSESSSKSSSSLVPGTSSTFSLFSDAMDMGSVLLSTGDKSSAFEPTYYIGNV